MEPSISISVLSEENAAVNTYIHGSIFGDEEAADNSKTEVCCHFCDTTTENFASYTVLI